MSSTKSTTLSDKRSDQDEIDAFDRRKWGRVATRRPGDILTLCGTLPCGKKGRTEHGRVLNAKIGVDGKHDIVLVATVTYGRRWFDEAGNGPYRVLSVVAKAGVGA